MKESYWTVTRALGLGRLHDGSAPTGNGGLVDLFLLRAKELYWTVTRAIGLGHLHDGRPTGSTETPWQGLLAQKLDALQIRLDVLAVQADVARVERLEILEALKGLAEGGPLSLGDRVMFRTPWGVVFAPVEDGRLVASLSHSRGRLEPGTSHVLWALLAEGDVAIDVGAHIGLTVLPMACAVGRGGRVLAIEPGSRASGLLRETLVGNSFEDRVEVHVCAAGPEHGEAALQIGRVLGHSSLLDLPEAEKTEIVAVRPLDALLHRGQSVRLIKIDAEGYEPHIWRGMRRILAENPKLAAVVEFGPAHLRRAGVSAAEWLAVFQSDGFTPYEIVESRGTIQSLRRLQELETVASINLLMMRQPLSEVPKLSFE